MSDATRIQARELTVTESITEMLHSKSVVKVTDKHTQRMVNKSGLNSVYRKIKSLAVTTFLTGGFSNSLVITGSRTVVSSQLAVPSSSTSCRNPGLALPLIRSSIFHEVKMKFVGEFGVMGRSGNARSTCHGLV